MWSLLLSLVALGLAGWALWFRFLAALAREEVRANRLELVSARLNAADEQAAKETALRLLDELMVKRTEEVKEARAHLQALQQKYEVTLRLYRDSIAIDGPLASRRVQ